MGDRMGSSPINRTIKETSFVYQGKRGFLLLSGQNTGAILKNRAPERSIGCSGRNGRRNTFFNDCGHRLHSLCSGQPQLIIVGRVKRYY